MKIMVLAAGRGERMRPLTDHVPKPLLPVAGRPLLLRLIERVASCGYTDIVINVSHLGEMIEDALGDGASLGARIVYSRERKALETAGGIAAALPLLGDAPFIVMNGDIYTDFDLRRLQRAATALTTGGPLAHLVLVDNPAHHPEGDFCHDRGMVVEHGGARLTFSGIGVYHPTLFDAVPRGARHGLAALLRLPIAEGRVSGEHHPGLWIDVGTPARLEQLEHLLATGPESPLRTSLPQR
jgi:MurNAc alpha-1-phosphate uridylyltransferase